MNKEDSSGEGKSTPDAPTDVPTKAANADLYENRGPKKIIRVVTVMAYLFSVSFVGILLSAYYLFLWEPPNPRFILRERLRTDPQLQYLIAPPSEKTDVTKKDNGFLLQKPFLGSMTQEDAYGDDPQDPNFQKKRRLNATLRKLRHLLVNAQRAQKQNSSHETTGGHNSSITVEKVPNMTMSRVGNTISRYNESRGNISEEKTNSSDNTDLPVELARTVSTLSMESTTSASTFMTIPGIERSKKYFHKDSVTNVNPIIEEKTRYYKKELGTVESYLVPVVSNATTNSDVTNNNGRRDVSGDNDFFEVIQKFLKIVRKKPMRSNETDDRRLAIDNDRKNDPGDVQTSVVLNERVNGSIGNSQENYSNDEASSKDQVEQIARDGISIDLSSRHSRFIDNPGFHQTPDDPTVKSRSRTMGTRNSEETQIERMTARSTTIDNKQLEEINLPTTQQQKSFSEIITETANVKETAVELTSISTTRDYHNFTSITNGDDSVT
ncbi:uncharacterized protein LOC105836231 [Monomorium pharaonis]|uniref:uncharacterized protein LOC105836231 n=1 Tax=Monomorium pharaonis TaxID=307658 RepID=UPI00063FB4F5|nr:uncharacterized protein LOC105836231 [Monomorium pharaonis]